MLDSSWQLKFDLDLNDPDTLKNLDRLKFDIENKMSSLDDINSREQLRTLFDEISDWIKLKDSEKIITSINRLKSMEYVELSDSLDFFRTWLLELKWSILEWWNFSSDWSIKEIADIWREDAYKEVEEDLVALWEWNWLLSWLMKKALNRN